MNDPNITIEECIRLEEEKARRHGKVYNWETATYGKIWNDDDVHDLRSIKTKFPAIVFGDAFTSEVRLSYEPTVSPPNDNETEFRISFDECTLNNSLEKLTATTVLTVVADVLDQMIECRLSS
ncbi:hypothetical protein Tco_0277676 [Tanacetum coccineum]